LPRPSVGVYVASSYPPLVSVLRLSGSLFCCLACMLPTQTLFNRAYKLWHRRPGDLYWDENYGLRHRSIEEIWAKHLPDLPESEYAALVARFREIDHRAYELGRRFHDEGPTDESGSEALMREFPELAPERASDAYGRGVRGAAY